MLSVTVITNWMKVELDARGVQHVLVRRGPEVPSMPDRLVIGTLLPGSSRVIDGNFERPRLQWRVRGKQNIFDDAEDLMKIVDHIMMESAYPLTREGVYFLPPEYVGGDPAPLALDDGGRTTFVGNYMLMVETRSAANV